MEEGAGAGAQAEASVGVKRKANSSTYCCVPLCNNYARGGLRFHLFPKDLKVREAWKVVLKMGKAVTNSDRVCSEHFLESDYLPQANPTTVRHLKKIALPSQKLPVRQHDKVDSSPQKRQKVARKKRAESRLARKTTDNPCAPGRLRKSRKLLLELY